jgi:hypothetical protein
MLHQISSWSLTAIAVFAFCTPTPPAAAQQKQTKEPVFRVAKNKDNDAKDSANSGAKNDTTASSGQKVPANLASTKTGHALDPSIDFARDGLARFREEVRDYTGMMVKRERVNGKLMETEFIKFKIRNPREINGKKVPFSIYMRFLKPAAARGREVIWIEGENKGKLIAHDNPNTVLGKITVKLDPNGNMAMKGNRYPIYDAGIEKLISKLIEKGSRDRAAGHCLVTESDSAKINKRPCSMIQVVHPEQKDPLEFHKCKIYVDKELNLPVRFVCWDWPQSPNAKPKLLEEYTYVNLKLNVGLTDKDFDPSNPDYDYRQSRKK